MPVEHDSQCAQFQTSDAWEGTYLVQLPYLVVQDLQALPILHRYLQPAAFSGCVGGFTESGHGRNAVLWQ